MPLTYSATLQTQIASRVFSLAYSGLTAVQKTLIDGDNATTPADGSSAAMALVVLRQYADMYEMAGATIPDEFSAWFVCETAWRAIVTANPQREPEFRRLRDMTMEAALSAFARVGVTDSNSEATTLNLQNIRYHVVSSLLRMRPPVSVSAEQVDNATRWALQALWNRANWNFRRRFITATIGTDSTFTVTAGLESGETVDKLLTRRLYHDDGSAIIWASADVMARRKAVSTTTGRPTMFRVRDTGTTRTWQWDPSPDAAYTVKGEALVGGPGDWSNLADTTPFVRFPVDFHPTIRDLVLMKVLRDVGRINEADFLGRQADEAVERLLPEFQDVGEPDNDFAVRDVYGDWSDQGAQGVTWRIVGGGAM